MNNNKGNNKKTDNKQGGVLAFIFLILTVLTMFILKSNLSIILAIISLILSIKDLKHKNALVYISLIGSILAVLFCISSLTKTTAKTNDAISEAKLSVYKNYEGILENYAERYIYSQSELYKSGNFVLSCDTIIDNFDLEKFDSCDGYIIVNKDNRQYDAYIKCKNYETDGFDSKYMEKK